MHGARRSYVDKRRCSAADQKTSIGNVKKVLYYLEFAFLRNNGTVAFLRPTRSSCTIEYYEGVPIGESAVATRTFREVNTPTSRHASLPEFVFGETGSISCRLDRARHRCPNDWFPSASSLQYGFSNLINFMEYRMYNLEKRGSAHRPPPRPASAYQRTGTAIHQKREGDLQ